MGFDLYGLAPENPKGLKAPHIDWGANVSDEEKGKYFEQKDKYHEQVPGEYFRSNVWWWRPLWAFSCHKGDNILTSTDMDKGSYNDCHKISKTKAKRLAKALKKSIKDGSAEEYERSITDEQKVGAEHNSKVDEKLDAIKDEVIKATGKKNIVPGEYPNKYKKQWDKIYVTRKWTSSYPFKVDFLKEFIKFCETSGGFEIG